MILSPFLLWFVMLMAVFILVGFPPPPVGLDSQGRRIYCSSEHVALAPPLGLWRFPPRCARHPGEEFAQQLGRSGFSVPLGPCWGTSTRELFSLRFWEVKLRRKQADFLTKRKRRAMSPSPFLVLLLARPTSCCRPSRNVCPWIHFPPPAKELQRDQWKYFA